MGVAGSTAATRNIFLCAVVIRDFTGQSPRGGRIDNGDGKNFSFSLPRAEAAAARARWSRRAWLGPVGRRSGLTRTYRAVDGCELALEEAPLGPIADAVEGGTIGVGRLFPTIEAAEQIGARGVE